MARYGEKLRDPRWQRMRLEVMRRDGWKCVACLAADRTLNVHHVRYADRGGDPWAIDIKWLETLCEKCHESRHFPGDLDLGQLTLEQLRDFVGWSWGEENAADHDAIRAYHAAKQEQAWALIFGMNRHHVELEECA